MDLSSSSSSTSTKTYVTAAALSQTQSPNQIENVETNNSTGTINNDETAGSNSLYDSAMDNTAFVSLSGKCKINEKLKSL